MATRVIYLSDLVLKEAIPVLDRRALSATACQFSTLLSRSSKSIGRGFRSPGVPCHIQTLPHLPSRASRRRSRLRHRLPYQTHRLARGLIRLHSLHEAAPPRQGLDRAPGGCGREDPQMHRPPPPAPTHHGSAPCGGAGGADVGHCRSGSSTRRRQGLFLSGSFFGPHLDPDLAS